MQTLARLNFSGPQHQACAEVKHPGLSAHLSTPSMQPIQEVKRLTFSPAPTHSPTTVPCVAGTSASGRSVSASARDDARTPRGAEHAQAQGLVDRRCSLEPWHLDRHSRQELARPEKLRGSWQPPRSLSNQVHSLKADAYVF